MNVSTHYCSFCGKSDQEVNAIIQAPEVAICNECVYICVDLMYEQMTMKRATAGFEYGSMGEYL